MLDVLLIAAVLVLGFLSVILNTVTGGGGGAVLVPALILFFNHSANDAIATTFVVIAIGAVVSTLAFARQGRVDYRFGFALAVLTLPGTILGAFLTASLSGPTFQFLLGVVIMVVALLPLTRRRFSPIETKAGGGRDRKFTDAFGTDFSYRVKIEVAVPSAIITGFVSGIFGAGGALVLTPGLIMAGFPVHIALGTVRLAAVVLALTASVTRFYLGQVDVLLALWLSIGAVCGALVGARVARILKTDALTLVVSFGIFLLGLALALKSVF